MADSKVKVRIYGQEYTIRGERDEDTILKIAATVDEKMHEVGKLTGSNGEGLLAVLTAINFCDESFEKDELIAKLKEKNDQLEKDTQHYIQLWDDAKKNFIQYKEGANRASEDRIELEDRIKELEKKCSEFESSYFDLQMENIKLTNELDSLKKDR